MPQRKIDRPACLAPKVEIERGEIAVNWYHDFKSDLYRVTVSQQAAQDLFAIATLTSSCYEIDELPLYTVRLQAMEDMAIRIASGAATRFRADSV